MEKKLIKLQFQNNTQNYKKYDKKHNKEDERISKISACNTLAIENNNNKVRDNQIYFQICLSRMSDEQTISTIVADYMCDCVPFRRLLV